MSIKVDVSGLETKIFEKSIAMKKSLGQAMKEEGGLLCVSLIKYTQPFGTGAKAKGQGESAIKYDLTEAFYILPDALLAGATPDGGNMRLFISKGVVWLTPQSNWMVGASIETLQAIHQDLRKKSNVAGRIRRNRNKVDIQGRVATVNLFVISTTQFDALFKLAIKEVGFAKAGWVKCGKLLGRSNDDIQAWIKNHDAPGSVIDNTNDPKPTLTLINEVNYSGRVLSESAKREAVEERRDMITLAIGRAIKFGVKDK